METKKCRECGEYKSLLDFHKKTKSKDGRQSKCKECNQKSVEKWQKDNPDKYEATWKRQIATDGALLKRRLRTYQLSEQEYNELLEKCEGKCTICKEVPSNWLVIDHCHTSGVVRGLLCNNCNTGLGYFKDDPIRMLNAIEYLNNASLV